jgi:hypothetical protein
VASRQARGWPREEITMPGKTPQKASSKKVGKTLKEKRAIKKEKKDTRGGGSLI